MVNCWLCVTNEENWQVVKKKKIWGIPKRFRRLIERVQVGDFLVFYVRPKRVAGVFQTISEMFHDDSEVFSFKGFDKKERFPFRVRLQPVVILKEPIQFDKLIPQLKFIVSKKKWTGYLRRAMLSIPKEDYDLILDIVTKAPSQ